MLTDIKKVNNLSKVTFSHVFVQNVQNYKMNFILRSKTYALTLCAYVALFYSWSWMTYSSRISQNKKVSKFGTALAGSVYCCVVA